jgi:TP901 family phage tail tape measure protein
VSVVANVAINVDSRDAVGKLRQVEQATNKLDQTYQDLNGRLRDANGRFIKTGEAAQAASGKVNTLGNAVKNLASQLVVADLARRFFKGFDEAEKAAAAVRTLGVDSKALEAQLLGVSNRLGGLYSQTQLLAASYDVASAGFANAADNAKILEASAKGATGGLSDINTVGNAVTSVLNAYGKSAAEAGLLVDGFIQTQNDGKIVLNEYAQQIGKLAPTAAATGVGINELNAAIATITAQGVPVEATFTGLNQALVSILKPSKEASDLAKALGIDFSETGLRAKGFGGLLKEVKEKTGGSTTALVQLFGSVDALKAVLPLVNDDLVKYNKNVQKQADVSGVADRATQELGGTVSAEVSKMINQIGNLTRSLDTVLGPALGGIVRLINVVIAQATQGINVLGQLFSLSKNTAILKGALQSGDVGTAAASRALPGIDELIGEKRRKQLATQAGAGSGFLGIGGLNTKRFTELLKKEPAIQKLLGPIGAVPTGDKPSAVGIDPAIQAILEKAAAGSGGGGATGGKTAANEAKKLADELQRSVERGDDLFRQFSRQAALLGNITEEERKRLQIQYDFQDRAREIGELKNNEQKTNLTQLNDEIRRLQLLELQTDEIKKQLELFYERAGFSGQPKMLPSGAGAFRTDINLDPNAKETRMDEMRKKLDDLVKTENQVYLGAQAIGEAFGTAFKGVASGAMTAQEALAGMMSSIADHFLDMAAQIITQQMTMIIYGTIMKALGLMGGAGSGFGVDFSSAFGANAGPIPGIGGAFGGGMKLFADGGFVTGPTSAVVGEGGEPEYIIPASKMRSAMSRYAAGARGSAVIPTGDDTSAGGGTATMAPTAIDVRYTVERINSVDYVTADQFRAGMAQAAQQGATQGEQRTLRRLQQSRATRSRLGMN